MAWYEESFKDHYLELYSHRDQHEGRENIARAVEMAALNDDAEILDLCCGAGRHLLALHSLGFSNLSGLDLSRELLQRAQKELLAADVSATLIQADMRNIPAELSFDCIFSLFTSFGYFENDEDNHSVIVNAAERLKPGGVMLMDTINPSFLIPQLVEAEEKTMGTATLKIKREITADPPRVQKTTRIVERDGQEDIYFESVRLFSAQEFHDMYVAAGFDKVELFGSLQGHELTNESPRLIIRAQRC